MKNRYLKTIFTLAIIIANAKPVDSKISLNVENHSANLFQQADKLEDTKSKSLEDDSKNFVKQYQSANNIMANQIFQHNGLLYRNNNGTIELVDARYQTNRAEQYKIYLSLLSDKYKN